MRRWLPVIIAVLLPAASAFGQTTSPAEAVIAKPEVLVRSAPTDKSYPTSKLHLGDRVVVRKESTQSPGWLEITPPPRSFSWISAKALLVEGSNGVVRSSDPVYVRPGSEFSNDPPNVERIKLSPGTQVYVLPGKPVKLDGEDWLPIRPHITEVRYIPADAVKRENNIVQNTPSSVPTANPLLDQAEQAYRSGDSARAIQLFKEVYEKSTDWNDKARAYNRLQALTPRPASAWQPGPGSTPANSVSRPANTSLYNQSQSPQQMVVGPPQWSVKGRLRRTGIENDGQPVYVLENQRGEAVLRVTAAPGLRLRDFEGREIALFGQVVYRSDAYIRTYYMSATHVALY